MSKANSELPVKQIYEDLEKIPERNPASAAQRRAIFLHQAAAIRNGTALGPKSAQKTGFFHFPLRNPALLKAVMTAVLVVVIFLGGTVTTVFASQNSLPGQNLYPVKTWSEDALLALTFSAQTRAGYEMDFTDRRIVEMEQLINSGTLLPESVYTRLQSELNNVLQTAANLGDSQMLHLLQQLQQRAEVQLQTLNRLVDQAAPSDLPLLLQAQAQIQEQVQLCALGETDPQGFRNQVRQRYQYQNNPGNESKGQQGGFSASTPQNGTNPGPDQGDGRQQGPTATQMPGVNGPAPMSGQTIQPATGTQSPDPQGFYGPAATATPCLCGPAGTMTPQPGGQKNGQ